MADEFRYDVFLSYSAKDKPVVRPLAERLHADGVRVWLDEWMLKPGANIPHEIEQGLEQSRVLVLCMSANAFGSDWAHLESSTFRFRDPLNKDRRFIPLRLDDAPVRGSLGQFLYIRWQPEHREEEYAKLLEACRSSAAPVDEAPAPEQGSEMLPGSTGDLPKLHQPRRRSSSVGTELGLDQTDVHESAIRPREVVCMEYGIDGFREEHQRATNLLSSETSSLSEVEIYITARRDIVYAHSNFLKQGCLYPTKLITNQQRPLEIIAANLVATEQDVDEPYFMSRFWRSMVDEFTFLVEANVVASPKYSFLDFSEIQHAYVIDTDDVCMSYVEWNQQRSAADSKGPSMPRNPWIPGLFYLFVLLAVLITLRYITGPLGPWILPVLIVGGLLAVSVIGAFTLRNQELLKEKNFLELMFVALRYLPVVGTLLNRGKDNTSPASRSVD
jgi:hypothetical protein